MPNESVHNGSEKKDESYDILNYPKFKTIDQPQLQYKNLKSLFKIHKEPDLK